ncbi:MAG: hypothetical protein WC135_02260 [Bacteroidales bacterium]
MNSLKNISIEINEKINQHLYNDVVSYEELIKQIAKNLNFMEEKVRTILDLYFEQLEEIKLQDPENFKKYIKERFNAVEVNNEA